MKLENNLGYINDSLITKEIIEKYKNHPSIKAIQDTFPVKKQFKIEEAKVEQVNKILRNINLQFIQFSKGQEKELRSKLTGQLAF